MIYGTLFAIWACFAIYTLFEKDANIARKTTATAMIIGLIFAFLPTENQFLYVKATEIGFFLSLMSLATYSQLFFMLFMLTSVSFSIYYAAYSPQTFIPGFLIAIFFVVLYFSVTERWEADTKIRNT